MAYNIETHQFEMDWQYPPDYQPGDFYLGEAEGQTFGYRLARHAGVIGGPRSGKGAGFIIPNLYRWPENVLCIDPKGENVSAALDARIRHGQNVRVFDPFRVADVPDEFRASWNPLLDLDPEAIDFWEQVMVFVDGLVKVHDPKHGHWDNGTKTILAGLIADMLARGLLPQFCTLPYMRDYLLECLKNLKAAVGRLREVRGFANLPKAAAEALARKGNDAAHFIAGALENTDWMDSDVMGTVLESSDFRISDVKHGRTDVFLVLPPQYIRLHSRFLRMFVRSAITAMGPDVNVPLEERSVRVGAVEGRRCLFLLDEFHALGRVEEIEVASGLMPGYGVHMVWFTQNLGQLSSTYGKENTENFIGNCDVVLFFGMMDQETPKYVSDWIGPITHDDLGIAPSVREALDWYALPPDAMAPAELNAPHVPQWLFDAANAQSVPANLQLFHSRKSPGMAMVGNALMQSRANAAHAARMEESARARMMVQRMEMERQHVNELNRQAREYYLAHARAAYEQAKRRQEEAEKELRRAAENMESEIRFAVGMVGKPRITAYDLRIGTAKASPDGLAQAAIVLTPLGVRITRPKAYFETQDILMIEGEKA